MVFSSITFLFVFLPVFLAIYYLLDRRFKNAFLLLGSLLFYYWGEPKFVWIMISSILWNYICGIVCGYTVGRGAALRKLILFLSVGMNLGLLFYYKYFNFTVETLNHILPVQIPLREIILPIGISFFTFQGMSYVIDVYRGQCAPQKNPLKLGMYIAMFPQLIAGPIVRYVDIEKDLERRTVTSSQFYEGTKRFTIGLAKKTLLANTLAVRVDQIFAIDPSNMLASTAWLGALMFSLQLYFDFAGYSDMAIGLGHMLGFTFLENFNLPYISNSVREFWRRWHMSLSSWFRDYVYIPLGGSRTADVYLNLLIVFLLTGLWHGAAWNFVAWGLWHGIFLVIERIIKKQDVKLQVPSGLLAVIRHGYTLMVVMIGWVMFRSDTLIYALDYLKVMFGVLPTTEIWFDTVYFMDRYTVLMLMISVFAAGNLLKPIIDKGLLQNTPAKMLLERLVLAVLLVASGISVMVSSYNPFLYFRF